MPSYKNLFVLLSPPHQRARICASWPSLIVHQKYQETNYPHLTCRCWYESPYNNKDKYLSCHLRENTIQFFKSDDSDIIISQRLGRQRQINWGQRGKKKNWKEIDKLSVTFHSTPKSVFIHIWEKQRNQSLFVTSGAAWDWEVHLHTCILYFKPRVARRH